jgi:1-acyl-sn-glycerol-3-phosphate acyltransferase
MEHLSTEQQPADLAGFRERSLTRGVNPVLYWTLRALFVPFFLIYFRMQRIGREHLPRHGALILASNHRSFLDPFVIGTLVRRPVYYMAKRELFEKRWQAWALNALGAFPVDRGTGDEAAMDTARAILARGDCVVVFPEGTRVRSGLPPARRRAPRAADGRAGGPDRRPRLRPGPPGLAHTPAQGPPAGRSAASVPACRALLSRAGRLGHRARLDLRQPAVGLAARRGRCGGAPR